MYICAEVSAIRKKFQTWFEIPNRNQTADGDIAITIAFKKQSKRAR